jgi:DNA-binding NarL/FixJ family response regulator
VSRNPHPKTIVHEQIRILLCEMTPMFFDIISETIATQADLHVAGNVKKNEDLLEAADRTSANVLIISDIATRREQYEELLHERPRLKVLEIASNDGHGLLYEMRPQRVALGEMSATSLLDVIRASACSTSDSGARLQ